jgi:hypothetical protein
VFAFDHPRSEWVPPAPPITGPALDWSKIRYIGIHYTAADDLIDGDPGENWDRLDDYLRNIQTSYINSPTRGYSIGYNAAVDARGETWELRGFDIRCAANSPGSLNAQTVAILQLVDGADPASPAAVKATQAVIAEAQRRAGRPLTILGHRDLPGAIATACPGVGLRTQVTAGVFTPTDEPSPPTLTPRSRPMWVIAKNESTGVHHVSDGVWRRTVGTNPDPIIWASVAGGWPLKDAATGKTVAGAADVTGVPASFIEGLGVVARDMPKVAP